MNEATTTPQKTRIHLWDNLKFVLILLVVFGHFIHTYNNDTILSEKLYVFILSFHMPTFLFISGLFSKKTIRNKNYYKCFDYFVLYIFSKLCIFVCKVITEEKYKLSLWEESSVPWYAFALMVFVFFTILLQRIHPVYLFIFAILMGCISGYDPSLGDQLVASRILVFYPFFLAGYFLDGEKIIAFFSKIYWKFFGLAIYLLWFLYIWNSKNAPEFWHPLVTGRESLNKTGINYFWYRAIYYGVIFILIFAAIALTPSRKTCISAMGSRSVQVFTLHRGLIYIFYDKYPAEELLAYWGAPKTLVLLFGLSILLTLFLSLSFLSKPLQWILHPKRINTETQKAPDSIES